MIISLFIPIFISLSIGFLLTCILWPGKTSLRSNFLIKINLSLGVGLGISSCLFFLWLLASRFSIKVFISLEILLLICLFVIFLYYLRKKTNLVIKSYSNTFSEPHVNRTLAIAFFVAFIFVGIIFILLSIKNPHGGWDAWASWNIKAKFLFESSEHWRNIFSDLMRDKGGPSYPLFLTGSVARCWKYINDDTVFIPIIIAMFFILATIGLIFSSISVLRGKNQAYLAGLTLLGTSFFIIHGANQYADVPLAFFFLSTIILFSIHDRFFANSYGLLFLAGMMAGFAAWTKNEGLLFLIIIAIIRFIAIFIKKGWKTSIKQMFFFTLGLFPVLLILIYYKTQIAPTAVIIGYLKSPSNMSRLTDLSRHSLLLEIFGKKILNFGNGIVGVIPLLAFYLFLLGIKIKKEVSLTIIVSTVTIFLMLGGYFFILLQVTADLRWTAINAIDRLFLHLWPSFIFVYFMIVKTPEEYIERNA